MPHIFISYAKKDTRPLAEALDAALNSIDGLKAWMDKSLEADSSWARQIQREIERADYLVVLLSPDVNREETETQSRSFVLNEIDYAQQPKLRKLILPVMVYETIQPIQLAGIQHIDLTETPENPAKIIERICRRFGIEKPVETPQTSLAISTSRSYKTAYSDEVKAAIDRAYNFKGTRNKDWTPFVTTFPDLKIPDMRFCLVPVGSFMMGEDDKSNLANPTHMQIVNHPFWIAQYPITNIQWAIAIKHGIVDKPQIEKSVNWYKDPIMQNAPVSGVTLLEAQNFIRWLDCRLLTEQEWEYSARGIESFIYPWGDAFQQDWSVYAKNSSNKPWDVTTYAVGASWVDARHMSGNIWEWTSSLHKPYPYKPDDLERKNIENTDFEYVLRGGAFTNTSSHELTAIFRGVSLANKTNFISGFRVGRSL